MLRNIVAFQDLGESDSWIILDYNPFPAGFVNNPGAITKQSKIMTLTLTNIGGAGSLY